MRVVLRNRDVWSGILFVAFGASALWIAQDYDIGTATRMGPGSFPTLLGWMLVGLGLIVMARGFISRSGAIEPGSLRPFLVILGAIAFAFLIDPAGLVIATAALVVIASFGGRGNRVLEVAAITVVLIVLSISVFVLGLGMTFPIWPNW